MALIKCLECGKEFSDKAAACPNCGCPVNHAKNAQELPDDEKPDLFKCTECGRPLPVGIDKCIYCGFKYNSEAEEAKEEVYSGVTGRDKLQCPVCKSKYIGIQNDIPLLQKIGEIFGIGTVLPETKAKYRSDMIYVCKKCGTIWDEDSIIRTGKATTASINPFLAIATGILSIVFSIILIAVGNYGFNRNSALSFSIMGIWSFISGILSFLAINKIKISRIAENFYLIAVVFSVVLNFVGIFSFVPTIIFIIFTIMMKKHSLKLS